MSDPGLDILPDEYRGRIFDAIDATPRHRYQVLTKRPAELLAWMKRTGRRLSPSVWMGTTIGHAKRMDRIDALRGFREVGARVLFVSAEPLLTALPLDLSGIDWIITGGESGRHASQPAELDARFLVHRVPGERTGSQGWAPRPDRIDWVRGLRDEADRAGCAHWFKQWGGPRPTSGGRLLDGVTHDGMPVQVPGAMPLGYEHVAPIAKGADRYQLPLL